MLLYLGTQTSTNLYFNSRLPESNRGHVNILINDWIVYDDRPYCVRSRWSRRVEPTTLLNMTGDVEKAYCWAGVPPGELIEIRYPQGLKRYHPQTKEELYCVLRKNSYGHPAAAYAWSAHRDGEILRLFNDDQGTCHQAEMDPCLVIL